MIVYLDYYILNVMGMGSHCGINMHSQNGSASIVGYVATSCHDGEGLVATATLSDLVAIRLARGRFCAGKWKARL